MKKILFVCTGNICRSSSAQAIARHKAKELGLQNLFIFDSAGTSNFHEGEPSDHRSIATAQQKGVSFHDISSRQINKKDFEDFDLILCMDRGHLSNLFRISDKKYHDKIHLFLQYCLIENYWDDEVIDPYYGSDKGFEEVFMMIENALEEMFKTFNEDKI